MDILKDVLISANQIDRFFGRTAPCNLFRAYNLRDNNKAGIFDAVESPVVYSTYIRPADVVIENGTVKVARKHRGISVFDKDEVFTSGNWMYYKIPKGTQLPKGLVIVKDKYKPKYKATHYTIAPEHDMSIEKFRRLLNDLAIQIKLLAA